MTRLARLCLSLAILFFSSDIHAAEIPHKVFKTRYTRIHYQQNKDIDDFIWRLGGERIEFPGDNSLASNRVDRIVERVETILDMQPKYFKDSIYLQRGRLDPDRVAYYDNRSKAIHIYIDYATDGVLAHEIAHAVISQYFPAHTPTKIQEILTQYVDKYLWSDY